MIVSAITNAQFDAMAPRADMAVLRIFDPTDGPSRIGPGWGASLALAFWDMEASALGIKGRLVTRLWGRNAAMFEALAGRLFDNDIPWRPFIAADAETIAAFADGLAGCSINELVVVCRAGRGRSAAVGGWIARRLGARFQTTGDGRASAFILETLDRVAGHSRRRVEPTLSRAA